MSIEKTSFGTTIDCKAVELYTIKNKAGASAGILTYGGTLHTLTIPDKLGNFADILIARLTKASLSGATRTVLRTVNLR